MLKKFNFLMILLMSSLFVQGQGSDEVIPPSYTNLLKHAVIAHRGSTYWTPEETEAAFRWARNIGADYLEADIQRSKDGVLLALHDDLLVRTSNIERVFPNHNNSDYKPSNFTYEQLLRLDAGTWFNAINRNRARLGFSSEAPVLKINQEAVHFLKLEKGSEAGYNSGRTLKWSKQDVYIGGPMFISSLEDLIMISKGWMPARNKFGLRLYDKKLLDCGEVEYVFYYVKDPADNGNRPGIYIETKEANQYPGIEEDIHKLLKRFGYLDKDKGDPDFYKNNRVNAGNTDAALILQTFSENSLVLLNEYFNEFPICFLLWEGDPNMPDSSDSTYIRNLKFASENGADIIGPSISGAPNNYSELLSPRHSELIREYNFAIHGYSFDTQEQIDRYFSSQIKKGKQPLTDSFFVNKAELIINNLIDLGFYPFKREKADAEGVLKELGY